MSVKIRGKRAIIPLFIVILVSLSMFFLVLPSDKDTVVRGPVSREEATEISWSAHLVVDGLASSTKHVIESIDYYNASMVERLNKIHGDGIYADVPQGHDIWEVLWAFVKGVEGTYLVIVIIDVQTGFIVHEEMGGFFL
jgi:hypothetical protein